MSKQEIKSRSNSLAQWLKFNRHSDHYQGVLVYQQKLNNLLYK
ncbi:hypothetical protein [Maribacter dokdonensis]|nr:hypothetical protein [Maribacter dokdonensis]